MLIEIALTLNKRSWAICSQGNDIDIKQHFRGIIPSSRVAEAAAYACFAASDATDAARRTTALKLNPFFESWSTEFWLKSCLL